MSKKTIIAFGHSHLGALQSGYDKLRATSSTLLDIHFKQLWGLYHPFVRRDGESTLYNGDLENELLTLANDTEAAALVGTLIGSEHFIWSIQGQSRPFDIILPTRLDLPRIENAEIIPYELIRRLVNDAISEIAGFYGRIQSLSGLPVYQILPPPPVSSQERTLNDAPGTLREMMLNTHVPSWIIRYKLWLLWTSVSSEVADRDSIHLLWPPPETQDENGLLLDIYCGDSVHGNDDYGCLSWRQLEADLTERS